MMSSDWLASIDKILTDGTQFISVRLKTVNQNRMDKLCPFLIIVSHWVEFPLYVMHDSAQFVYKLKLFIQP